MLAAIISSGSNYINFFYWFNLGNIKTIKLHFFNTKNRVHIYKSNILSVWFGKDSSRHLRLKENHESAMLAEVIFPYVEYSLKAHLNFPYKTDRSHSS